ncbi:hypothetical protein [Casimicrobium huifangae]|jgi:hypothetical protein|uniref:hypothetical protein n=1 Tax=Casimicrobium huifangae TaxID=2591109 RepID=UPI002C33895E|nr:hypothetical protein [Casimicrobium huifangae]HQA34468.1 hypothetical protein [Casimicrobium huifangae]
MSSSQKMEATSVRSIAGQIFFYGLFIAFIGVFSRWPSYQALAPDRALVKLSFSHHGKPVSDCHQTSAAELAKLPPNMRAPVRCPRERSPVTVELDVDGALAYRHVALPSGISRDGAASVYHRLEVPAGQHRLQVRLADDARVSGFAHVRDATVTLAPTQILVIDFDSAKGGITLQ